MNTLQKKACIMTKKHKDKEHNIKHIDAVVAAVLDPFSDEFYDFMHESLKGRVSKKRLKHIEGVADTAEEIAIAYGKDPASARLAGLLHDWDKGMNNEEIISRVHELGIEEEIGGWVIENMPEVIHGISASFALGSQFPQIPDDILHAIKVHTTACRDMSDMDKILYIADAIEPNRNFESLSTLRDMIGEVELDDLFFEVYKFWTDLLITRGRALHPDTIDIWNNYCLARKHEKQHPKTM